MADKVQKVAYYYATVSNRPGVGAEVLGTLRDAGVNLLAFHAFPARRRTQLDFVPEDARALVRAARTAGLELSPKKTAFLATGKDRPGAATALLEKLGDAGINVTAMDAVCASGGRYGALFWVAPEDVRRAAKVLGAR